MRGCSESLCCLCDSLPPERGLCDRTKCCLCADKRIASRMKEVCPCAEVDTASEAFKQHERTREYKKNFDRGSLRDMNGVPQPDEFVNRFQSTYMRDYQHPDIQALYHGYEQEAAGQCLLDSEYHEEPWERCCSCPITMEGANMDLLGGGGGSTCNMSTVGVGMSPTPGMYQSANNLSSNCHCDKNPCECEYSIIYDQYKPMDDISRSKPEPASMQMQPVEAPHTNSTMRLAPSKRTGKKLSEKERNFLRQSKPLRSRSCCGPRPAEPNLPRCSAPCAEDRGYGAIKAAYGPPAIPDYKPPKYGGASNNCAPTGGQPSLGMLSSIMNRLTNMESDLTSLNNQCRPYTCY